MGYWIVELSNGQPALITDDLSITPDSILAGAGPGSDYGEQEKLLDEILSGISNNVFGDWNDFLTG
ncbi:hypothetical protein [Desmospora profundinema]|uniref:Uncharacterized protein n=1 Tax=Desmospora profundinema TaxID=1571184 RepID=A0ABU1IJD9_9BACL|nr:hypothetical protein [Desmospora profundinema]MDR6224114.1 hypothetical protein [Desmospora profundinema]